MMLSSLDRTQMTGLKAASTFLVGMAGLGVAACLVKVPVLRSLVRPQQRTYVPFVGKGSVVLITGATCVGGIGACIALSYHERFQAEGASNQGAVRLIIVGRKPLADVLKDLGAAENGSGAKAARMVAMLSAASTLYVQADLAQPTCGRDVAAKLTERGVARVDAVLQLAGVGWVGPAAAQTEESARDVMHVNLRGPILLAKHLLPFLNPKQAAAGDAPRAKLVFASSIVSQTPTPMFAAYSASKAGIDHFAWSMMTELGGSTVGVQLLHVGATRTRFHSKAGIPEGAIDRSSFASPEEMAKQMCDSIDFSRELRSIYGSARERFRFTMGRLLPQHAWRVWKTRSLARPVPAQAGWAIVTGGSSGIGQALVHSSPAAKTLSIDRATSEETRGATQVQVDLSGTDLTASFQKALAELGKEPVSVLVNNAGVNFSGRLHATTDDQIVTSVAVNATAPLVLTACCLRHNAELGSPPPSLVFVSSLSHYVSYPGSAAYGATKDAVASLAKSFGFMLAGKAPVLTVFPGPTRTPQAASASPFTGADEEEKAKGRRAPADTARDIWESVRLGHAKLVPGLAMQAVAARASRDHVWAQQMIKVTQLDKLDVLNGGFSW